MKKLSLFFALLVLITIPSLAQLEKGSWIGGVNGNLSFMSNLHENRIILLNFNPYTMYLVRNNFALGLNLENELGFGKSQYSTGNTNSKQTMYNVKLAPTLRKYFYSSKLRPYIGLSTGMALYYKKDYYSSDTYNNNTKTTKLAFILTPDAGVSYWLNEKVFFDLNVSYDLYNSYKDANYGYKTLDLKLGIGIKIGK